MFSELFPGCTLYFFVCFSHANTIGSVCVSLSRPSVLLFRLWCPSRFSVYQLCNFLSNAATLKWYLWVRHVSSPFGLYSFVLTSFLNLSAYVNSFMSFLSLTMNYVSDIMVLLELRCQNGSNINNKKKRKTHTGSTSFWIEFVWNADVK